MIEIFAGCAILCSVAKQAGLVGSIAVDKVKKSNARSTIFQLNLLKASDRYDQLTCLQVWTICHLKTKKEFP